MDNNEGLKIEAKTAAVKFRNEFESLCEKYGVKNGLASVSFDSGLPLSFLYRMEAADVGFPLASMIYEASNGNKVLYHTLIHALKECGPLFYFVIKKGRTSGNISILDVLDIYTLAPDKGKEILEKMAEDAKRDKTLSDIDVSTLNDAMKIVLDHINQGGGGR